jgi:hypothetical protein
MMILRSLLVLGVALSLLGSTAEAAKAKGKKKKEHALHGKVEFVKLENKESDKGKDIGSITIKIHAKKKKGIPAKDETFRLAASTKVERVKGKKGDRTTETVTLAELKAGEHVHLLAKDGEAKEIKIMKKGKKKNA